MAKRDAGIALAEDADPFALLRAALAEADHCEGYEVRLLAVLLACAAPLTPR
ncbi:hypothetical protein [Delftia acidovorans]|uniref:Uncharacterized protein n=1 Tax=Delftia acidovorans TaxID=80866 RepID=A0AAJ2RAC8_DELAC|nr:hypothetical protein [Delftia acidovorans]MDX4958158.1 hypothetical protein [Delftia acidovorans]